jgi:hypothetical protein
VLSSRDGEPALATSGAERQCRPGWHIQKRQLHPLWAASDAVLLSREWRDTLHAVRESDEGCASRGRRVELQASGAVWRNRRVCCFCFLFHIFALDGIVTGVFRVLCWVRDREANDGRLEEDWWTKISSRRSFSHVHGAIVVSDPDHDRRAGKIQSSGSRATGDRGSCGGTATTRAGIWYRREPTCAFEHETSVFSKEVRCRQYKSSSDRVARKTRGAAIFADQSGGDPGIVSDRRIAVPFPRAIDSVAGRHLPTDVAGRHADRLACHGGHPTRNHRAVSHLIVIRY